MSFIHDIVSLQPTNAYQWPLYGNHVNFVVWFKCYATKRNDKVFTFSLMITSMNLITPVLLSYFMLTHLFNSLCYIFNCYLRVNTNKPRFWVNGKITTRAKILNNILYKKRILPRDNWKNLILSLVFFLADSIELKSSSQII